MAISPYMKALRERIGNTLVLMPSVAAIIRNDLGQILFQRRSDTGLWCLPSGAIDPGESPARAIVREVHEETGLHVEPISLAGVFGGRDNRMHYLNDDVVEYTTIVFECRILSGELGGLDDETMELRYCSESDRPPLIVPLPDGIFEPAGSRPPFFG